MAEAEAEAEEIATLRDTKKQADDVSAKLQLMHKRGYLCDVVLSVGQREFPAHRIILAKNSDYFEGMFGGGLKETNEKRVEIEGVDAEILEVLVGYCYGSPISIAVSKLLDLLAAADMLQFQNAKEMCCSDLQKRLNTDNVIDVYESAKLFNEKELKMAAEVYMRNNFRVLAVLDRFLDFDLEDIEAILSCEELDIITEMDVFHFIENWCRHKQETRKNHFSKLLKLVRLHHLPANVVVNCVGSSPLVKGNVECMEIVMEYFGRKQLYGVKCRSLHAGADIFVIGGDVGGTGMATSFVYKYSGLTESRSSCPPKNNARSKAVAASYQDKIYVYGGEDGSSSLYSREMFCRQNEVWCTVKAPSIDRKSCGFCECDGWLYAVGGRNSDGENLSSAERYDPIRDEWMTIAEMGYVLSDVSAVNHKGSVYIIGLHCSKGNAPDRLAALMYDHRIGKFHSCGAKSGHETPAVAVSVEEKIYHHHHHFIYFFSHSTTSCSQVRSCLYGTFYRIAS